MSESTAKDSSVNRDAASPSAVDEALSSQAPMSVADGASAAARILGVMMGLLLIVVGLILSVSMFNRIVAIIDDPEALRGPVGVIASILDTPDLAIEPTIAPVTVEIGRPVAMVIYLLLVVVASYVALAIMLGGAKVIYWVLSDGAAVRRLLRATFGRQPAGPRRPL